MKLPVLSAADGAAWEERFVAGLAGAGGGVAVVRRCVDVVDLLAVAATGQGRAVLLAAGLRRLDAEVVDRLRTCEVVPVGVLPRGDDAAQQRLRAMGVLHVVPDEADPAVVAAVLVEAVRDSARPGGSEHAFADTAALPVTGGVVPPGVGTPPVALDPDRRGSVVAVWGPTGAPGRTTVAVTLADEIARLGHSALIVDADVYGGAVAPVLGMLDESPGVAAACRQASSTGLDVTGLAALSWQLGPRLRVLTGIPLASRWPELRPPAVTGMLATARHLAEYTVVDCGFCLETDEELSFDTMAPRRNGATLAVLDEADVVLVVGAADPIGMQRLVRGLTELRDAEVAASVRVVLNKVRGGVVPGDVDRELCDALERFAGRSPSAMLPFDGRSVDAALARGQLLSEAAPNSPLRAAVGELAATVAGEPARALRRRRR